MTLIPNEQTYTPGKSTPITQESQRMVNGSCLCGGIRFRITSALNAIQACHCQQCRKAQGAAFATNIPVETKHFLMVKGHELLREFESRTRKGKYRVFCSTCGSPIYSRLESAPDSVRVRAGTLDEPLATHVALHQFVAYKANWWTIADKAPQYKQDPPK